MQPAAALDSGTADGSDTAGGSAGTAAQPGSEQPPGDQPSRASPSPLSPDLRQRLLLCLSMAARVDYLCPDGHPSRYEAWEHLIIYTHNAVLDIPSQAAFLYEVSDGEEEGGEQEEGSEPPSRIENAARKRGGRSKRGSKSREAGKAPAGSTVAAGSDRGGAAPAAASSAASAAAESAVGSTTGAAAAVQESITQDQKPAAGRHLKRPSSKRINTEPDTGHTANTAALAAAHCSLPGLEAASGLLWRYGAAMQSVSRLGGLRVAAKAVKQLQQEARRQAVDGQLQLLAAGQQPATEGQLQPPITAHQLQHALCCEVVAAASRLLNRPDEGRPIQQRPPALPPAIESEVLAAAGLAAKLLIQLEPGNPKSWNVAAAAAGVAGRPQLAAENALQCFRLGQAQGCDYYTAAGALGSTVLAGTCGLLLGRALVEAAVAAFPHAQPALHRAK